MPKAVNHVEYGGNTLIDLRNDTVTSAEHIMAGYYGHLANGNRVLGTGQGGPSATQHTIEFEFSDGTSTTLTGYWDAAFITSAITATAPSAYGGKQVTLAQLDGVTWYAPTPIPIGEELIDFNEIHAGAAINDDGSIVESDYWNCVTEYTPIDSTMTFAFKCNQYANIGFYDANKNPISSLYADAIKDSAENYVAYGTLTPARIPANAKYVVLVGNTYGPEDTLSLIRTA